MFFFGKSDIGKKRKANEDSFIAERLCKNVILCAVCDGMGGAKGGNVASGLASSVVAKIVADAISEGVEPDSGMYTPHDLTLILKKAVSAANRAVYDAQKEDKRLAGMGTTLIIVLICDSTVYAANVGDSRLYHFTGSTAVQVSKDHSYVQYLVDMGKITMSEAEKSPNKNIITKAIGIERETEPDIFAIKLPDGDTGYLLLCSDGLSNFIPLDDIKSIIFGNNENSDGDAEVAEKVGILIDSANSGGGGDNITAVLIKYSPEC